MCRCTPSIRTPFCGQPGCTPEDDVPSAPTISQGHQTWDTFRATGLLWFINTILHAFGWALVMEMDSQGTVVSVYPSRVTYRGFPTDANERGYLQVADYLDKHASRLNQEIQ